MLRPISPEYKYILTVTISVRCLGTDLYHLDEIILDVGHVTLCLCPCAFVFAPEVCPTSLMEIDLAT